MSAFDATKSLIMQLSGTLSKREVQELITPGSIPSSSFRTWETLAQAIQDAPGDVAEAIMEKARDKLADTEKRRRLKRKQKTEYLRSWRKNRRIYGENFCSMPFFKF